MLKAIASNYSLKGDFLQPELRIPFRQAAEKGSCSVWCTEWYKVRTEVNETFELLQLAYEIFQGVDQGRTASLQLSGEGVAK